MKRLVIAARALIPFVASAATPTPTSPSRASAEVRQHGTTSATCWASRPSELVAVAGESKAAIGGLHDRRGAADRRRRVLHVRSMRSAEPLPHRETPYTRDVARTWSARRPRDEFRVDYDLPMENVVDYKLGGAEGHLPLRSRSHVDDGGQPGLPALRGRSASSTSCSAGITCCFLASSLLLARRRLQERRSSSASAFTVAHSVTLALADPRGGRGPERDRRAADRRVDRLRRGRERARRRVATPGCSWSSSSASCTASASPAL